MKTFGVIVTSVLAMVAIVLSGPKALSFGVDTGDPVIHVLSSVNKQVVAVGESFSLEIEIYAVLGHAEEAISIADGLSGDGLKPMPRVLEFVRSGRVDVDYPRGLPGTRVAKLTRTLVLRPVAAGRVTVPSFELQVGGKKIASEPRTVYAYQPTAGLHATARGIVPVYVERVDPVTRTKIIRNGSAFFVAHDALVTSYHVVSDARKVFILLPDGKRVSTTKVWSVDPARDVAVLHVNPKAVQRSGISPLSLASGATSIDSYSPDVGRAVFTNGWPGGLRRSTAGVRFPKVRLGHDRGWVTSNPVGPGDSGGPLLNRKGEVVGIVTLGTMLSTSPTILREHVCIANDPRPAIGLMNVTLGPRSMKSVFRESGFRRRPYVQAFRLLAMISQRERFDESLRDQLVDFEAAVSQRDADPGLHFMRGVLYRMLGTRAEANESFARVLHLFEDYFPATYMLGLDRLREGRLRQAKAYFDRTLAAEPYRNLATYGLARTMMGLHYYEEAARLLENVAAHDPHFAPALYHLAICQLALGRLQSLAITFTRVGRASRTWQRELEIVVSTPVYHPRRLEELPRAQFEGDILRQRP